MPRGFEEAEFERLTSEARVLVAQAVRQERELARLVEFVERFPGLPTARSAAGGVATDEGAAAALVSFLGVDVLERIRSLCTSARGHRQDVERFLAPFAGGPGTNPAPRVLIVDDAQDVRDMLAIALETAGLQPLTAADGLEALIAAHVARPEAILMDINMPVLNGIEATRLLRASASTRAMAVLAHTAKPDLLAPPLAQTFDFVLTKPAAPSDIVAALQAVLPGRDRPASAGS